jgi:hypothetical protein
MYSLVKDLCVPGSANPGFNLLKTWRSGSHVLGMGEAPPPASMQENRPANPTAIVDGNNAQIAVVVVFI